MRHSSSDYRDQLLRGLVCSPGVVAVWDFYCPTGSVIRDRKGTNHITIVGSPTRGGAIKAGFLGMGSLAAPTFSDGGNAADSADLTLGNGPLTIMCWATRDSDSGGTEVAWAKNPNAFDVGIDNGDKFMIAKAGVDVLWHTTVSLL